MAVLVVLILIVKFCVIEFGINGKSWETEQTAKYIETFVFYFIIGVTVLVVAVPEGLPLAVTLALAYSVRVRRKMTSISVVRIYSKCVLIVERRTRGCNIWCLVSYPLLFVLRN